MIYYYENFFCLLLSYKNPYQESIDYYTKNYLPHKYLFRRQYSESDFSFEKEFNERCEKLGLTQNKTNFIAEGLDASYDESDGVINADIIFPLKVPNKSEELLKLWYGEGYMNIPSDIVMHHYSEYNQTLFETQEELDMEFQKVIKYLTEINDNFE